MEKADHMKICSLNPNHRKENVLVKRISGSQQCHEAFELAVRVFMEFEAPDYSTEGINEFMLFFVDSAHQRQGIGRRLFELAMKDCPDEIMTVNAAPFAIPIYEKLGFNVNDAEQIVNGIRFTPMITQIYDDFGNKKIDSKALARI